MTEISFNKSVCDMLILGIEISYNLNLMYSIFEFSLIKVKKIIGDSRRLKKVRKINSTPLNHNYKI